MAIQITNNRAEEQTKRQDQKEKQHYNLANTDIANKQHHTQI